MKANVTYWLDETAARFPDKTAYADEKKEITFAQLRVQARAIATVFTENVTRFTAPRRAVNIKDFHIAEYSFILVFQICLSILFCPFHNPDKAVAVLFR